MAPRRPTALLSVLALLPLIMLLGGCGRQACSYCGQLKYCKEFDILGTTRLICEDCLNNPAIAISGNVVRDYSTLYENGTLEYPEGSPLRDDYVQETTAEEAADGGASAAGDMWQIGDGSVVEVLQGTATTAGDAAGTMAAGGASTGGAVTGGTESGSAVTGDASTGTAATGGASSGSAVEEGAAEATDAAEEEALYSGPLSGEGLIATLNQRFQADGYALTQDGSSATDYLLCEGDTDRKIRFSLRGSDDPERSGLSIDLNEGASTSDYAKAIIRTILAYVDSDDYDGLGHDIYNNTTLSGSYDYDGITFRSITHSDEEVERGASLMSFEISP